MIVTRALALTAVAVCLFAQTKPKDVGGWDKVRWDATISSVRSSYGVAAQPENKDGWSLLQLPPVRLGGVRMSVQVGAPEGGGKIAYVRLWSYFGLPDSAPGASVEDFDRLRSALTKEYGDPANEEAHHEENFRLVKTANWKFPSTLIQLKLEQSSSLPTLGSVYLDYTPAGK